MTKDQAHTLALQAVHFLVSDEDLLNTFLAQSGLILDDLKTSLTQDDTLAGILDCFLAQEEYLINFCNQHHISPQQLIEARRCLPGGYDVYG